MKRALIISYYWPPSGGSGVQRWVKFSKYLPGHGWQPVIYTPENPELIARDESLQAEVPDCAEVIRRHITEPYSVLHKFSAFTKKKKDKEGEVNPINSQKKSFPQKLMMFIRGNFFIPDPRCFWIGPSVRFLKKYLKEHPVDVIVSTGPPHSMHLIARRLSKTTGLPWIADFRDPWTKMFYFKHLKLGAFAKWKHARMERSVLDAASTIVAVSPLVQDDFRKMTSTPVELITNGFDEDDFREGQKPEGNQGTEGKFTITHTGLFANDGNPETLWKSLAAICREDPEFKSALRIRLCGKTDREIIGSIRSAGLEENLTDLGYQDHRTAVMEQQNASILILPLRKEPEYKATLPGKLFEYLASGRPVLGIGQKDGAMARILSDTHSGITLEWEEEQAMTKALKMSWELFKAGQLELHQEGIMKYSRKETASEMAQLMDRLSGKAENPRPEREKATEK